jgi:uncharacterized membrane protein HdeD (DUF308 family)
MKHHIMAKFWWILAGRGVLGIILGATSFVWTFYLCDQHCDTFGMSMFLRPAYILASLILMLGCYAFLDGLFAWTLGSQDFGGGRRWTSLLIEGTLSVALGVWTWSQPEKGVLVLLYWIGAWALATGLLEIRQSWDLTEYKDRKRPLLMVGVVSILYGAAILLFRQGGVELLVLTGLFAIFSGIPFFYLGLHLRRFAHGKYQPGVHRPIPRHP